MSSVEMPATFKPTWRPEPRAKAWRERVVAWIVELLARFHENRAIENSDHTTLKRNMPPGIPAGRHFAPAFEDVPDEQLFDEIELAYGLQRTYDLMTEEEKMVNLKNCSVTINVNLVEARKAELEVKAEKADKKKQAALQRQRTWLAGIEPLPKSKVRVDVRKMIELQKPKGKTALPKLNRSTAWIPEKKFAFYFKDLQPKT